MKNLSWPQVVAVVVALVVVGGLALLHVDTSAIVTLIIALLLGGVAGTVSQVRDQTNGNHTAMLDLIRELGGYIARSPALPETPPAPPADQAAATSSATAASEELH